MARQQRKRKLVKRPGWFEAAKALGVNYSHLRRVLIGERQSRELLDRFHAWEQTNPLSPANK